MIAAGTRIATPDGEVPVESLRAGDMVLALENGQPAPRPVRWVGRLRVDPARHPNPSRAAPVLLRAGALAEGLPTRDLLLAPGLGLLVDGTLFQAQALRNGATIAQQLAAPPLVYVTLELPRHAAVLAEGIAVETLLDTGQRERLGGRFGAFAPDLAAVPTAATLAQFNSRAFALPSLAPAAIAAAHAALVARARALGWRLTHDPDFTILADGEPVPIVQFEHDFLATRLPAGTRAVRLLSRSFVPGDLDPGVADRRVLGMPIRALHLAERPLAAGAYTRGWHLSEPEWRWTDGDGRLTLRPLARAQTLELRTAPGAILGYWLPPA